LVPCAIDIPLRRTDSAEERLPCALIGTACSGEPGAVLIAADVGATLVAETAPLHPIFPKGMISNVPGLS
jgi:hypothetical protein